MKIPLMQAATHNAVKTPTRYNPPRETPPAQRVGRNIAAAFDRNDGVVGVELLPL